MCASLLPIHLTASVKRRGSIRLLAQREMMMMMIIRKTPVVFFFTSKFPSISKQERMTLKLLLNKFWEQKPFYGLDLCLFKIFATELNSFVHADRFAALCLDIVLPSVSTTSRPTPGGQARGKNSEVLSNISSAGVK